MPVRVVEIWFDVFRTAAARELDTPACGVDCGATIDRTHHSEYSLRCRPLQIRLSISYFPAVHLSSDNGDERDGVIGPLHPAEICSSRSSIPQSHRWSPAIRWH